MRCIGLPRRTGTSTFSAIVVAAALLGPPSGAAALTLEQERSFSATIEKPLRLTPAASLAFDRFDPGLGVLTRVEIALNATLTDFAVTVVNPNPFTVRFKSYAQLDTTLRLGDRTVIGWFGGDKTGLWNGGLEDGEEVTIRYTPAFLGAFTPRDGDRLASFLGVGDIAFALNVLPRFELPRTALKPDFTSCAPEDQAACDARAVSPLAVAVAANGAVSGTLRLRYIYDKPAPRDVSAVPLPAAGPMLFAALAGFLTVARRKRRHAQTPGAASATPRSR